MTFHNVRLYFYQSNEKMKGNFNLKLLPCAPIDPDQMLNYIDFRRYIISLTHVMLYKLCKHSFFLAILLINVNIRYDRTRILNRQCRIVHHSTGIHFKECDLYV